MTPLIEAFLAGYLLGSIPFGLILTRLAGLGDIRAIGSGSIGATNVLRTGRKDVALATLLLDAAKGAFAVLITAQAFGPTGALAGGCAAVLGHCVNVWLGFRGGKGVATGLGVILILAWPVAILCGALWLTCAWLTKRSSAAALVASTAAPLLMLAFRPPGMALATALVSLLIIVRHQTNIRRLLAGTEPRIGASK